MNRGRCIPRLDGGFVAEARLGKLGGAVRVADLRFGSSRRCAVVWQLEPHVGSAFVDAPAAGHGFHDQQASPADIVRPTVPYFSLKTAALVDHFSTKEVVVVLEVEGDRAASMHHGVGNQLRGDERQVRQALSAQSGKASVDRRAGDGRGGQIAGESEGEFGDIGPPAGEVARRWNAPCRSLKQCPQSSAGFGARTAQEPHGGCWSPLRSPEEVIC